MEIKVLNNFLPSFLQAIALAISPKPQSLKAEAGEKKFHTP